MDNVEENVIWTEKKCIQLIREYKSRPILWDSNEVLFYKHAARSDEWESIGRALNTSAEECKYKMNILMSSFRREKSKLKKGLKDGKSRVTTWFAFMELSFLLNRKIEKKKLLNTEEKSDMSSSSNIEVLPDTQIHLENNKSQQLAIEHTLAASETIYAQDDIKGEPESDAESDLESSNQTFVRTPGPSLEKNENVKTYSVQTSTEPTNTEEIEAFTNFVKSKMKKHSEKTLHAVQKAVCDILFKADVGYYENDVHDVTEESDMDKVIKTNISLKRKRDSSASIDNIVFEESESSR